MTQLNHDEAFNKMMIGIVQQGQSFKYTREMAVEDGVMTDLSKHAKTFGFKGKFLMDSDFYHEAIFWNPDLSAKFGLSSKNLNAVARMMKFMDALQYAIDVVMTDMASKPEEGEGGLTSISILYEDVSAETGRLKLFGLSLKFEKDEAGGPVTVVEKDKELEAKYGKGN